MIYVECADPRVLAAHQRQHGPDSVEVSGHGEGWATCAWFDASQFDSSIRLGRWCYRLVFRYADAAGEALCRWAQNGVNVEWFDGDKWVANEDTDVREFISDLSSGFRIAAPEAEEAEEPRPDGDAQVETIRRLRAWQENALRFIDSSLKISARWADGDGLDRTWADRLQRDALDGIDVPQESIDLGMAIHHAERLASLRPALPDGLEPVAWSERYQAWVLRRCDVPRGWWASYSGDEDDWIGATAGHPSTMLVLARPVPEPPAPETERVPLGQCIGRRLPGKDWMIKYVHSRGSGWRVRERPADNNWEDVEVDAEGRIEVLKDGAS